MYFTFLSMFFILEDEIVVTIDDKDGEGKFNKAA